MTAKRLIDLVISVSVLLLSFPVQVLVGILVKATSRGPAFHRSNRVGLDNELFSMLKFRTMRTDAPNIATHVMDDPQRWLTWPGGFLRSTSLDELPQLWNVVKGQMSLVGPRPALFNQDDLIELRTAAGVHRLRPGITGLAQILGRDDLPIADKVELDKRYLAEASLITDLSILLKTVAPVLLQRSVRS